MSNRFAILNLDDSDVEENPSTKAEQLKPIGIPNKKQLNCRICHEEHWTKDCPKKEKNKQEYRNWKKNEGAPAERRDWHLEEQKKSSKPFRPFSKGNIFHESHSQKKYTKPKQFKYLFQDEEDAYPHESTKHTTPEANETASSTPPCVPELFQNIKESTLAEKIRKALEKQDKESQEKMLDISGASYSSLKLNRVISK